MTDPDLNFIVRQLERVLHENANIRDDLTIVTAMVSRVETGIESLRQEMHAVHRQIGRMNDRISKLEDAAP